MLYIYILLCSQLPIDSDCCLTQRSCTSTPSANIKRFQWKLNPSDTQTQINRTSEYYVNNPNNPWLKLIVIHEEVSSATHFPPEILNHSPVLDQLSLHFLIFLIITIQTRSEIPIVLPMVSC